MQLMISFPNVFQSTQPLNSPRAPGITAASLEVTSVETRCRGHWCTQCREPTDLDPNFRSHRSKIPIGSPVCSSWEYSIHLNPNKPRVDATWSGLCSLIQGVLYAPGSVCMRLSNLCFAKARLETPFWDPIHEHIYLLCIFMYIYIYGDDAHILYDKYIYIYTGIIAIIPYFYIITSI